MNTPPTRQRWKDLLCVPLKILWIMKLARSDNELEFPMIRKFLLKKPVNHFPVTPIL